MLGATLIDREEGIKECQQDQEYIHHAIGLLEKPDFFEKIKSQVIGDQRRAEMPS